MRDKGRLRTGADADISVFDPRPSRFATTSLVKKLMPVALPPAGAARDQTDLDRVVTHTEDNRDCGACSVRGERNDGAAGRSDQGVIEAGRHAGRDGYANFNGMQIRACRRVPKPAWMAPAFEGALGDLGGGGTYIRF